MLNAFYALKGKYADKKKLADEAIYLERVLVSMKQVDGRIRLQLHLVDLIVLILHADGYEVLASYYFTGKKKTT